MHPKHRADRRPRALRHGGHQLAWIVVVLGTLGGPTRAGVTLDILGPLPDHDRSRGLAINDAGQVAGLSRGPGASRAFRVTRFLVEDLGTLEERSDSGAHAINESGQVVGISSDNGARGRAFRYTDGLGMEDLGTLGNGLEARAHGINGVGQVTGTSATDEHRGQIAFRYTDGPGMESLGVLPGGDDSVGEDINDHGQVVGFSGGGTILDSAFRYTDGPGLEDLGTLPGHNRSYALGINAHGQVVGYALPNSLGPATPFLYTDGVGMRPLLKLSDERSAEAHAINADGWIVGWSQTDEGRTVAVLWRPDGCIVDLNDLVPEQLEGADLHLEYAYDIGSSRQIAGVAIVDGETRAFRLTFGDCPADVNENGAVDFGDILRLLGAWGVCLCGCPEDLDGSGIVDFVDTLIVLSAWGTCPANLGACCLPGSDCVEMVTLETCATLEGTYLGGRTSCVECRFGACCFDDDTCTDGVTESSCVAVGGTYLGDGTDCFECSRAVDDCADAVTVGEGVHRFSTRDTTSEGPDLPAGCDEGNGLLFRHDVWYRYRASCGGVATASLCDSGFDTRLAVYADSDTECPGGFLACADDTCGVAGTRSEASFPVESGGTYLIRIGARFAVGDGTLTLRCD